MRNDDLSTIAASLQRLGLDAKAVQHHATLLREATEKQQKPTFKIHATCRLDNGGLLALPAARTSGTPWGAGYVSFIPAAGAASRYSQPLYALIEALQGDADAELVAGVRALAAAGALTWPLPVELAKLVAAPELAGKLSADAKRTLLEDLQLPKALMPCVREGVSFLAMKHLEHARMPGLTGELFITPPGRSAEFASRLSHEIDARHIPAVGFTTRYLEQGPKLSTIRWHRDGRPFVEESGDVSQVPAGHGSLAQLFPETRQLFPTADSVLIRNIDNVMGTGAEVLDATGRFLSLHRTVLSAVQKIRLALAKSDFGAAGTTAQTLLTDLQLSQLTTKPSPFSSGPRRLLHQVQAYLFHTPMSDLPGDDELRRLYERPVNLMGQVPNTAKDVGGTACTIELPGGDGVNAGAWGKNAPAGGLARGKVCLEVPHANAADKQHFLEDDQIATHFNPGYCAIELTATADYYASHNQHFWLMAEKIYRGQPVMYFETVLYELLGNSAFANAVFVEVPRAVFNPHKTLKDAMDQTLSRWV